MDGPQVAGVDLLQVLGLVSVCRVAGLFNQAARNQFLRGIGCTHVPDHLDYSKTCNPLLQPGKQFTTNIRHILQDALQVTAKHLTH